MVKKIIACSDIHIPSLKKIDELKEVLSNFIGQCKEIVNNADNKDEIRIVVAGDIFDSKLAITNESILAVYWFLSELDKICKTIVIVGNHDYLTTNKDRTDSLTPLFNIGSFENVIYLDKELEYNSGYYKDDNVIWCLYSSFSGFMSPELKSVKEIYSPNEHTYIGLIHGDVNGAVTPTNYITEKGLDPNVFSECDFVIAGHIHKFQEITKNGVRIVYCSNIKQKDFGESITQHGFVLWNIEDKDNIQYEFNEVKNDDYKFYKFEINSIEDIETNKEILINL